MANQSKPLFTIITVCLNSEKTIEKTISSVVNQTFKGFEYIIIDGGSTDKTLDIVYRYEKFITKIISEPDDGLYHAMNKGINLASGELIGIINSDDWYEPNSLELVATAYKKSNYRTVFYGLCKYFENGREDKILSYHHRILKYTNIAHPTCFVPRKIYNELGVFNTEFQIAADYELLLRFYRFGIQFQRIERVLANFNSGGISESKASHFEVLRIRRRHGQINRFKYVLKKFSLKFRNIFN